MCDIIGTFDRCPFFFVNENIGQKILSKDLENIVKKGGFWQNSHKCGEKLG